MSDFSILTIKSLASAHGWWKRFNALDGSVKFQPVAVFALCEIGSPNGAKDGVLALTADMFSDALRDSIASAEDFILYKEDLTPELYHDVDFEVIGVTLRPDAYPRGSLVPMF